jgi:hypothetical protein
MDERPSVKMRIEKKELYCKKETDLLKQNDLPFCDTEEGNGRRLATFIASLFGAAFELEQESEISHRQRSSDTSCNTTA